MKKINFEDFKPIEGFHVMEWLRPIREKYHELYMKDPKEYERQLKMIDEKVKKNRQYHENNKRNIRN